MPVIHLRVFYGKVGSTDQLVQHLKEGYKKLEQYSGGDLKARILTDYMSGRTDRVVTEEEADNFGEIEAVYNRAMADPQAQTWFQTWEPRLQELLHYAEAETWTIR